MSMPSSFANQLLVALPTLADPGFARSVALICQHDDDGGQPQQTQRSLHNTLR